MKNFRVIFQDGSYTVFKGNTLEHIQQKLAKSSFRNDPVKEIYSFH